MRLICEHVLGLMVHDVPGVYCSLPKRGSGFFSTCPRLCSHGSPATVNSCALCISASNLYPQKPVPVGLLDSLGGGSGVTSDDKHITLAALVIWFREFLTILDDDAVGGGGDGSWGSRPPRLLRVIDQRVGCAQEAVQLVREEI